MAQKVGAYEAKTHLSKLLDRVARGERFTITKHGVPVARLVPAAPHERVDPQQIVTQLRQFRQGRNLGDLDLRRMIEEGRR